MRALSIRQPWVWLIVHGYKPVENRDWSTSYRGELLMHASKMCTRKYYDEVMAQLRHQLSWFQGEYGWILANARPLPFHPCKGALSFFDVRGVQL